MRPAGNLLRHDFISVNGDILSFQAGSNLILSQGQIDQNESSDNPLCQTFCNDDKFDKYVTEAANEIGAPLYCVGAYPGTIPYLAGARNCQTWAREVLSRAKKKYLENEDCPKCFGNRQTSRGSRSR